MDSIRKNEIIASLKNDQVIWQILKTDSANPDQRITKKELKEDLAWKTGRLRNYSVDEVYEVLTELAPCSQTKKLECVDYVKVQNLLTKVPKGQAALLTVSRDTAESDRILIGVISSDPKKVYLSVRLPSNVSIGMRKNQTYLLKEVQGEKDMNYLKEEWQRLYAEWQKMNPEPKELEVESEIVSKTTETKPAPVQPEPAKSKSDEKPKAETAPKIENQEACALSYKSFIPGYSQQYCLGNDKKGAAFSSAELLFLLFNLDLATAKITVRRSPQVDSVNLAQRDALNPAYAAPAPQEILNVQRSYGFKGGITGFNYQNPAPSNVWDAQSDYSRRAALNKELYQMRTEALLGLVLIKLANLAISKMDSSSKPDLLKDGGSISLEFNTVRANPQAASDHRLEFKLNFELK